ncbi:hypothetical protein N7471_006181 [Penicillium samsonianum]|uniref:uncharacterized protein n=1 Tax=Penicillium samsonianum TaxID=1882272 RepID=UPI002548B8BA|nr:uncharacterized protein N7471_006181 [Penicillium samsonianum]KAJ6139695.1 hypothetical protein N7471_006181 [Penicillium samsonianum]
MVDPPSKDEGGMFALHLAAGAGDAKRVLEILQNHPSSGSLRDWLGRTAIHCAVENKKTSVLEEIVGKFHIDVINLGDNFGRTPLHWATEKGYQDIMQLLLDNGSDVDCRDSSNQTPLSRAALRGRHECVSLLLRRKARSDIPDQNGQLPLHLAAANGRTEVVSLLCDKESLTSIDSDHKTSLHLAAKCGYRDAAKIIMKNLIMPNVNGNHVFRTLEQADGWQNDFTDIGDDTRVLVWAALNGIKSMTIRLIRSGVDIQEYSTGCLMTAIQVAASAGHTEIVELLLNNKAKVNAIAMGKNGRTALQAAASAGHINLVELLLDNKADVNALPAGSYGRTALQAAAGAGHIKIVKLLLNNQADVNAPPATNHGRTALQAAVGAGHTEIVELLLNNEADVNAPPAEYYGRTALKPQQAPVIPR